MVWRPICPHASELPAQVSEVFPFAYSGHRADGSASAAMRRNSYTYRIVNVFTYRPFSGKAVAVFLDASGLGSRQMEAIARELRLPQCAFMFPPSEDSLKPRLRVFTPFVELPAAGLPMIATVFAKQIDTGPAIPVPTSESERFVLEQTDEEVSVAFSAPIFTVRQMLPIYGGTYPERETVAALLSLRPDQLGSSPLEIASSGIPYLVVPLKNTQALSQARLRRSIWERTLRHYEAPNILAFGLRGKPDDCLVELRVFTPAYGVFEEAASESAVGPLLGYLLRHRLVDIPESHVVAMHQGTALDRPSVLHAIYERRGSELTSLRVGGRCVIIGEGVIYA